MVLSERGDSSLSIPTHHRILNGCGSVDAHMHAHTCTHSHSHRHGHGRTHKDKSHKMHTHKAHTNTCQQHLSPLTHAAHFSAARDGTLFSTQSGSVHYTGPHLLPLQVDMLYQNMSFFVCVCIFVTMVENWEVLHRFCSVNT